MAIMDFVSRHKKRFVYFLAVIFILGLFVWRIISLKCENIEMVSIENSQLWNASNEVEVLCDNQQTYKITREVKDFTQDNFVEYSAVNYPQIDFQDDKANKEKGDKINQLLYEMAWLHYDERLEKEACAFYSCDFFVAFADKDYISIYFMEDVGSGMSGSSNYEDAITISLKTGDKVSLEEFGSIDTIMKKVDHYKGTIYTDVVFEAEEWENNKKEFIEQWKEREDSNYYGYYLHDDRVGFLFNYYKTGRVRVGLEFQGVVRENNANKDNIEALLESNQLKYFSYQNGERAICVYEGTYDSEVLGSKFAVYKETLTKDIVFVNMLIVEADTCNIYTWNEDSLTCIGDIGKEELELSEASEHDDPDLLRENIQENELFNCVMEVLAENGYSDLKLIYDGGCNFLNRKYYVVSLFDDFEDHIIRKETFYIDMENKSIYQVCENDDYLRTELYYLGSLNGGEEMEYALFLETNVGYGVTGNYYKYGIFDDSVKSEQGGEDLYFEVCGKILGEKLYMGTHEEWAKNEKRHIQNLSPDLQWAVARSYFGQTTYGLYKDEVIFNKNIIAEAEETLAESENIFTLKRVDSGNYDFATDEFIKKEKELVDKTWGYSYIWIIKCVTSMDEYGKLLAVSESDNQSIGIYDTENWKMIHHITIDGMDADYPIEVSQINGNEEEGWMVFSNGDVTYRMAYPDGEPEKIGKFMYDTTYSPDGKYLAYCTGNIVLNDLWMSLPDEKFDKINNLYIEWDKIAPGWYVEEVETGNKTYIPIETWEQDQRPLMVEDVYEYKSMG